MVEDEPPPREDEEAGLTIDLPLVGEDVETARKEDEEPGLTIGILGGVAAAVVVVVVAGVGGREDTELLLLWVQGFRGGGTCWVSGVGDGRAGREVEEGALPCPPCRDCCCVCNCNCDCCWWWCWCLSSTTVRV
jgi:hypothetical protein